jgi:type II secretory pathway component HofQ
MSARAMLLAVVAFAFVSAACQPQAQQTASDEQEPQTTAQASDLPKITVTFENTDIRDVLNNFADFTGKSFVPGPGVEGPVTASVRNQPWDLALDAILQVNGLHAVETAPGIVRVEKLETLIKFEELRNRLAALEAERRRLGTQE